MVYLIDIHGEIISNIYVLAPSESWVRNFFEGQLILGRSVIVQDANTATMDSEEYRKQFNEGSNSGGLE